MNLQKEYAGMLYFADMAKRVCQVNEYDYLNRDDDHEEFLKTCVPKYSNFFKSIGERREQDEIKEYLEVAWIVADWFKYKKIYRFDPSFVDYLEETDSGVIQAALLKRLPYKSFYISIPNRLIKDTFDDLTRNEMLKGLFVRVRIIDDGIRFGMAIVKTTDKTNTDYMKDSFTDLVTFIQDGTKLEDCWNYEMLSLEEQENLKKDGIDEAIKYWTPLYRIALNACQYLCASNAEIQDVKVNKKNRPTVMSKNGPKPVNIQISDVGFKIGKRFEEMYGVKDDSETDISVDTISGVHRRGYKMRPHVRRAHWHHYWTGKGRTDLEVRWVEPVFVMSDLGKEPEIAVIHDVKGDKK